MSSQILQELEYSIECAKSAIELGTALERLMSTRDFKRVITSGYFEKEAIRLVHLKSAKDQQSAELQKSIASQMDAIGYLKQYFDFVQVQAGLASKTFDDDRQTRDELMGEST